MSKVKAFFYRFRGYILGVLAIILFLMPASPLPSSALPASELPASGLASQLPASGLSASFVLCFLAILFYLFGVALRISARRHIGEHTRGKAHEAETLVTSGPYSRIRHPLYVSNFLIACGVVVLHLGASPWVFLFVFLVGAFEVALSRMEDSFLEARFGEEWRNWAKVTPAFIARLPVSPKTSASNPEKRSIWRAFVADSSTWAWLLVVNFLLFLLKIF